MLGHESCWCNPLPRPSPRGSLPGLQDRWREGWTRLVSPCLSLPLDERAPRFLSKTRASLVSTCITVLILAAQENVEIRKKRRGKMDGLLSKVIVRVARRSHLLGADAPVAQVTCFFACTG